MLYITIGRFKEYKAKPFQNWWTNEENLQKFQDSLPKGVKHIGTYIVVAATADHDFEQWFEIDNWTALDAWKNDVDNPNSKYHKIVEELNKELGVVSEWRRSKFLRLAKETTILAPED
jgi:hypothetical protein